MRKKRVLYHSDFALAATGFGRNSRLLLSYLWATGKYEIMAYCCGMPQNAPTLEQTPWKSEGAIPVSPEIQQRMQQDPNYARAVSYGGARIDEIIASFKPDQIIFSQDFWSFDGYWDKNWFVKINPLMTITLDSLPILQSAQDNAHKIKNFTVWSDFARKALHEKGHTHVKTLPGAIDTDNFQNLGDEKKKELLKKYNIPQNAFIIGSCFRNQLRKLVPNMLEGYALWKERNPHIKNTYLAFHTHVSEGWNLVRLAKEYGVDTKEILVTYVCRNCGEYEVKSFDDRKTPHEVDEQGRPKIDSNGKFIEKQIQLQDKDCRFCNAQKSQITCNVGLGITPQQLNEVYNLWDVSMFVFTSGGLEIPIWESKLCEHITLVTNYSCGEDACTKEAYSLPLEWATYLEHGTEFIKASTYPSSIAKQLEKVYNMTPQDRKKWGQKARQYTLDNFSIEVIGKKYEEFLDSCPYIDETDPKNFAAGEEKHWNPQAQLSPTNSDEEFIIDLYHKVLDAQDVERGHKDVDHWTAQIKNGMAKSNVENTFRNIAAQELQKKQTTTLEDLLDKNGKKRFLMILKDSAGDIVNASSLLESWRENHPENEWDLYFSCEPAYFDLLAGNPYIHKLLPFQPIFLNELACTGAGKQKGAFDAYCNLGVMSQQVLNYVSNHNVGEIK